MDRLNEVIRKTSRWLIDQQCEQSGGWAERPGLPVNPLNTAEAIIALIDAGAVTAGSDQIQKGIEYLKKCQYSKQNNAGAWTRWRRVNEKTLHHVPDIIRTSFVIQALIKGGVGLHDESIKKALNWLVSLRNDLDGGWGSRKGVVSAVLPTCFVLMALIEAYKAGMEEYKNMISEGLKFLIEKCHHNEGYFGDPGPLEGIQTIYAILSLQAARGCQLNPYIEKEKEAISWLLENPDKARKMVEWFVEIDSIDPGCNYSYLFMTESLLIRVLTESPYREHRKSELARDVMIDLKDRMDPSGAFYGYRIFTWATAKVLCSMSKAKQEYLKFPLRRPEYSGAKVGHILMIFIMLLLCAVVFLTIHSSFELLHAGVFVILMLAALLAYDKIREKTFKELSQKIISQFGKG
jgi:hypothetical protein